MRCSDIAIPSSASYFATLVSLQLDFRLTFALLSLNWQAAKAPLTRCSAAKKSALIYTASSRFVAFMPTLLLQSHY
jgi:hypothetical protein